MDTAVRSTPGGIVPPNKRSRWTAPFEPASHHDEDLDGLGPGVSGAIEGSGQTHELMGRKRGRPGDLLTMSNPRQAAAASSDTEDLGALTPRDTSVTNRDERSLTRPLANESSSSSPSIFSTSNLISLRSAAMMGGNAPVPTHTTRSLSISQDAAELREEASGMLLPSQCDRGAQFRWMNRRDSVSSSVDASTSGRSSPRSIPSTRASSSRGPDSRATIVLPFLADTNTTGSPFDGTDRWMRSHRRHNLDSPAAEVSSSRNDPLGYQTLSQAGREPMTGRALGRTLLTSDHITSVLQRPPRTREAGESLATGNGRASPQVSFLDDASSERWRGFAGPRWAASERMHAESTAQDLRRQRREARRIHLDQQRSLSSARLEMGRRRDLVQAGLSRLSAAEDESEHRPFDHANLMQYRSSRGASPFSSAASTISDISYASSVMTTITNTTSSTVATSGTSRTAANSRIREVPEAGTMGLDRLRLRVMSADQPLSGLRSASEQGTRHRTSHPEYDSPPDFAQRDTLAPDQPGLANSGSSATTARNHWLANRTESVASMSERIPSLNEGSLASMHSRSSDIPETLSLFPNSARQFTAVSPSRSISASRLGQASAISGVTNNSIRRDRHPALDAVRDADADFEPLGEADEGLEDEMGEGDLSEEDEDGEDPDEEFEDELVDLGPNYATSPVTLARQSIGLRRRRYVSWSDLSYEALLALEDGNVLTGLTHEQIDLLPTRYHTEVECDKLAAEMSTRDRDESEGRVNSLALCETVTKVSRSRSMDMRCPICLEQYLKRDKVLMIPKCWHEYHYSCVVKWFDSKVTCPVCRNDVREVAKSLECVSNEM